MSSPLRICHVWDADYPWDVRVEKVSRALTDAGHDVAIVARNRRREALTERLAEGTVHRLPPWRWLGRRLDRALMFPAFFSPRWYAAIARTIRAQRSDVLLVRDLPLAPTAIVAARRAGVPVVMDMAENYPAMLQELWDTGVNRPVDTLVRNPRAAAAIERWVLPRLDHLITVVEESSDRVRAVGVPVPPITVVSNTPSSSRVATVDAETRHPRDRAPKLVYLGLLEEPRGLRSVLHAVRLVLDRGHRVTLDVVGDGRERASFQAEARHLQLSEDVVAFHGRQPHEVALRFVEEASVGLVPHLATGNWISTIPNKLFDYMAAGLPVVASDVPPVRRVLNDARAGLLHAPGDAASLAGALAAVLDAPLRRELGRQGLSSVRTRFNWERDAAALDQAVRSVVRRAPAAPDPLVRPMPESKRVGR